MRRSGLWDWEQNQESCERLFTILISRPASNSKSAKFGKEDQGLDQLLKCPDKGSAKDIDKNTETKPKTKTDCLATEISRNTTILAFIKGLT